MKTAIFLLALFGAGCGIGSGIDPCQARCIDAQESCGFAAECHDTWQHCMAACASAGSPDHVP